MAKTIDHDDDHDNDNDNEEEDGSQQVGSSDLAPRQLTWPQAEGWFFSCANSTTTTGGAIMPPVVQERATDG